MLSGFTSVDDLLLQDVPEEAFGAGIHAGRRLVQHDDWRLSHQGHSHTELPLVAPRVGLASPAKVCMSCVTYLLCIQCRGCCCK